MSESRLEEDAADGVLFEVPPDADEDTAELRTEEGAEGKEEG